MDETRWTRRVELVIRREDPGGPRTVELGMVDVTAGASAQVSGLLDHLTERLVAHGGSPPDSWGLELGDGTVVGAPELLVGLPVRRGDRLVIRADRERHASQIGWEVRHGTRRWPIGPRPMVVGRGRSADIGVGVDGAVSRRHAEIAVVSGEPVVCDLGSTNGTEVDGQPIDGRAVVRAGARVSAGDTTLTVAVADRRGPTIGDGEEIEPVAVLAPAPARRVVVVPDPPELGETAPWSWWTTVLPAFLAMVLVAVIGAVAGPSTSPGWLAASAGFVLLGPVVSLAAQFEARRALRRRRRDRRAAALAAAAQAADVAEAARADELARRRALHPGPRSWARAARHPELGLWAGGSDDVGLVRLGLASVPSLLRFETASGTAWDRTSPAGCDPVVRDAIDDVVAAAVHRSAPATAELWEPSGRGRVIAVVGPRSSNVEVVTAVTLGLASRLPPHALGIEVIADTDVLRTDWAPLAWLRHTEPALVTTAACRVVVVDHDRGGDGAATRLADAIERGDAVIWFGADLVAVPAAVATLVQTEPDPVGPPDARVTDMRTGAVVAVRLDHVSADDAAAWARALASWTVRRPADGQGRLPPSVALADLAPCRLPHCDGVAVMRRRWDAGRAGLGAVIGVDVDGSYEIDLRRDGPNALVVGTTGSGKSELLRTWITSLASAHPPDRVTFLLIDYKGGAAFAPCFALPHVVGVVTDLDGGLAERVLIALRAEVRRREEIVACHGVADLAELADLDAIDPTDLEVPPSLVVVVDELAALLSDVPEFVDGLVDVARRGRSLGLHLVMATQRPSGVVDAHLLANVDLRIALRVSDPHDSTELVGVPDAASIPRTIPGRALVHVAGGIRTMVQTAWCGGDPSPDRSVTVRVAVVGLAAVPRPRPADGAGPDALVSLIAAAAQGLPAPRRPWLDPLPSVVRLADLANEDSAAADAGEAWPVLIGRADDPWSASQPLVSIDLAAGPLCVVGSSAETAAVVEVMVVSAVAGRSPGAARVDAIDAIVPVLGRLGSLPQVGSVLAPDDDERVERLLRDLQGRLLTPAVGARRVLVVHDLPGAVERWERSAPELCGLLQSIADDGPRCGVHLVVTSPRPGPPARLRVPEDRTLVLAEAGPPGRTVVGGLVTQLASLDAAGPASFEGIARAERRRWPDAAPPVGRLPQRLTTDDLAAAFGPALATPPWPQVALGLAGDDLAPVSLDLGEGHLLVVGPRRSGRTTALVTAAVGWAGAHPAARIVWVGRLPDDPVLAAALVAAADDIVDPCDASGVGTMALPDPHTEAVTIVVDDADELPDDVDAVLAATVAAGRRTGTRVVAAAEVSAARRAYDGVVAALRQDRRALLLQPDVDLDGDLVGVRLPRRSLRSDPLPPGRGELVVEGRARRIQVAVPVPPGDVPHIGAPPSLPTVPSPANDTFATI